MSSVFDCLLATAGCESIGLAALDGFIAASPRAILFVTGDTMQRPEASDVAVVVRELMRGPDGRRLRVGIIERRDEPAVMQRFGVVVVPALVLLRDGATQEIIARIRDWPVYTQAFARLLATAPVVETV